MDIYLNSNVLISISVKAEGNIAYKSVYPSDNNSSVIYSYMEARASLLNPHYSRGMKLSLNNDLRYSFFSPFQFFNRRAVVVVQR